MIIDRLAVFIREIKADKGLSINDVNNFSWPFGPTISYIMHDQLFLSFWPLRGAQKKMGTSFMDGL